MMVLRMVDDVPDVTSTGIYAHAGLPMQGLPPQAVSQQVPPYVSGCGPLISDSGGEAR